MYWVLLYVVTLYGYLTICTVRELVVVSSRFSAGRFVEFDVSLVWRLVGVVCVASNML